MQTKQISGLAKTPRGKFMHHNKLSFLLLTANLSVQIFTVPSVAHCLIEKHDGLTKMVEFFAQIFEDEAK